MTVQELINELQQIPPQDRDLPLVAYDGASRRLSYVYVDVEPKEVISHGSYVDVVALELDFIN